MSTIYFGELSIKLFIGVSPLYVSEGCPQNYLSEYIHYLFKMVVHKTIYRSKSTICIGQLSTKLFIRVCPLFISDGCPQKNHISEYVHYMYRRVVHKIIYRNMSTIYIGGLSTSKTNIFVLEMIFIHGTNMWERVGEDSRLEIGYVDIQVDMYVALGCLFDCATIACAIRWGVVLVGDYHYWALLTPS